MGLNIDTNNLKINQAGGAQDRSVANTGTSTSGNVSIFQNNDEAVKQLCNKLQISKEGRFNFAPLYHFNNIFFIKLLSPINLNRA